MASQQAKGEDAVGAKKRKRGESGNVMDEESDQTTIKCSLGTICKDVEMKRLIDTAVEAYTHLAVLSSHFLSFHCMRLAESGSDIPAFDRSNSVFVNRAIRACANIGTGKNVPMKRWKNLCNRS